jgi:pimeloyl-ACP methyl ester carboxylesterase
MVVRRNPRAIQAGSALSLALLLMGLGGCADQLAMNPSTHPLDTHGAERRTFVHDGRLIEFYVALSPGTAAAGQPQAYMLEFCGNSQRAETIATQRAARWGTRAVEVWVMNYPGFGRSDGPARLQSIPSAALAAYDHLAIDAGSRPIFVAGYSLGTAVAIFVAAHRPAAGLILQSPPPIQSLILDHYGWWNLWLIAWPTARQIPDELDSMSNGSHASAPALFVLSGRDSIVPIEYQRRVVDAYAGPKQILLMTNATHDSAIPPSEEARVRANLDWLWDHSASPLTFVPDPTAKVEVELNDCL